MLMMAVLLGAPSPKFVMAEAVERQPTEGERAAALRADCAAAIHRHMTGDRAGAREGSCGR
jgi:hypothetical protein